MQHPAPCPPMRKSIYVVSALLLIAVLWGITRKSEDLPTAMTEVGCRFGIGASCLKPLENIRVETLRSDSMIAVSRTQGTPLAVWSMKVIDKEGIRFYPEASILRECKRIETQAAQKGDSILIHTKTLDIPQENCTGQFIGRWEQWDVKLPYGFYYVKWSRDADVIYDQRIAVSY